MKPKTIYKLIAIGAAAFALAIAIVTDPGWEGIALTGAGVLFGGALMLCLAEGDRT
jgi:hypothetical protein